MRRPRTLEEVETGMFEWWNEEKGEFETKPIMEVMVLPGVYSDPEKCSYTWNITEWRDNKLSLQLYFTDYEYISTEEDPEKIRIIFYAIDYFRDYVYGIPVNGGPNPRRHEVLFDILPEQLPPKSAE